MLQWTFPLGVLEANCSILVDEKSHEAVVVDPGGDAKKVLKQVQKMGATLRHILLTHAHVDHVGAVADLKTETESAIWLHKDDAPLWRKMEAQCMMLGLPSVKAPPVDHWLEDGLALPLAGGKCLHTPGHSPGSCCFYFAADKLLISGDTLFRRSIGRTDILGGSFSAIEHSIQQKIYTLADDVRVVTGHGPETMVGEEKRLNEFIRPLAGG